MTESSRVRSPERIYIEERPWVEHYDEGVPKRPDELRIPEIPLYGFLVDAATSERYANKIATIFIPTPRLKISHTYTQLYNMARRFASFLKDNGVGKGDVVALLLPNSPQFIVAYYGALLAGAIVMAINVLSTDKEIESQLLKSRAKVLVSFNLVDIARRAHDAAARAAKEGLRLSIVWTGIEDVLDNPMTRTLYKLIMRRNIFRPPKEAPKTDAESSGQEYRSYTFSYIMRKYRPLSESDYAEVNPREDTAVLMFTGGTTGIPKGVELTHYNLVANVVQIDAWYKRGRKGKDVFVGALPWFHIYGQTAVMNAAIFRVGTILVFPRFNARRIIEAIHKYQANLFHGVPLMYQLILKEIEDNPGLLKRYSLRSLEACISGAAPLPVAVAEKFEAVTGAKLREGYGLTEASPVTHVNPILGEARPGSIGLPLPGTIAAIADPEKPVLLEPGEPGELVVSGPQVMKGYWNDPKATGEAIFACCGLRWLRTGDIAYMDSDGYFYIIDRKKDIIKYKGYSVYPREIEEVLYRHKCVMEAAVIGKPHKDYFEIPKAFIVLNDKCRTNDKQNLEKIKRDIEKFLRERLAPYKVPKEIEIVNEPLPKSPVGKILRKVLREQEIRKAKREAKRS